MYVKGRRSGGVDLFYKGEFVGVGVDFIDDYGVGEVG